MKIRYEDEIVEGVTELTCGEPLWSEGWRYYKHPNRINNSTTVYGSCWKIVPEDTWVLADDLRVRFVGGKQVYKVERKVKE